MTMVAYTDTLGFNKGTASFPAPSDSRFAYYEVTLDFAAIVAARTAAAATALAAGDTLQVLNLPAGLCILQGGLEVMKVESTNTTSTLDLGFTGGSPAAANVFANDAALNALGITATGLAAPVTLTAADTLDILINTDDPTDAVVRVFLVGVNVNDL
jgi:hypothetical protein